jgi:hypothetical protein
MNNKIGKKLKENSNDIIYTPKPVAELMISLCEIKENEIVLDPCRGGGVFYDNLPNNCIKKYCEIEEGIDFLEFNEKVDLIIGNPPYSIWNKWIEHTIKLNPKKICYIMNSFNLTDKRVLYLMENGYNISKFHILKIEWFFGHSFIVIFEKNINSIFSVSSKRFYCDLCNNKCNRGLKGNDPNKCNPIIKKKTNNKKSL